MPVPDESKAPSQLPTSTAVCGTTTGDDGAFKARDGETEKPTAGVGTDDAQQKEKPQDKKEESDDKPLGPDEDLPGKGDEFNNEGDYNNDPRGSGAVRIPMQPAVSSQNRKRLRPSSGN